MVYICFHCFYALKTQRLSNLAIGWYTAVGNALRRETDSIKLVGEEIVEENEEYVEQNLSFISLWC